MTVLVLRLAGPLQAWGSRSRFVRRGTEQAPTKSGVIGLLAAARGLRRTDPLTELHGLRFGVRVDQPGRLLRDFQTARDGSRVMPLSYRFYRADAIYLTAVEGSAELLTGLHEALRRPAFPLYLGRRSCPPAGPVTLGLRDGRLGTVLGDEPWQASRWHRKKVADPVVPLEVLMDTEDNPSTDGSDLDGSTEGDYEDLDTFRDEPISFDPRRREYGWRLVRRATVRVTHPDPPIHGGDHEPFALLGG